MIIVILNADFLIIFVIISLYDISIKLSYSNNIVKNIESKINIFKNSGVKWLNSSTSTFRLKEK